MVQKMKTETKLVKLEDKWSFYRSETTFIHELAPDEPRLIVSYAPEDASENYVVRASMVGASQKINVIDYIEITVFHAILRDLSNLTAGIPNG
jgi:hypothetical protein